MKCKAIAEYEDTIIQKVEIMGLCLRSIMEHPDRFLIYANTGVEVTKQIEELFREIRSTKCDEDCFVPDDTFKLGE